MALVPCALQERDVENADTSKAEGALVTAIWRLELARARHVLRAYLRTRYIRRPRTDGRPCRHPCMRQQSYRPCAVKFLHWGML
jgi:hypothetical protein